MKLILSIFFIIILLMTISKIFDLKKELKNLPNRDEFFLPHQDILNQNISDFIDKPLLSTKQSTTFLIVSPTCRVCHEKIETIIKKNSHQSKNILFYADAVNLDEFNTFKAKYKEININPLTLDQIKKINKGIFPYYIEVTPNGEIVKAFIK